MTISYTFNREDIPNYFSYELISETVNRSIWKTNKRVKLFNLMFPDYKSKELARSIIFKCNRWNLVSGIPESYTCNCEELVIWSKLETLCAYL